MKKILILFICILMTVSCSVKVNKYGKCHVNYSIIYPDTTITYDTTFIYSYINESDYIHTPYASSYKGSNYIQLGSREFSHTTCPIRINSYKTISKNVNYEK